MKVMVAGSNGMIGSALTRRLLRATTSASPTCQTVSAMRRIIRTRSCPSRTLENPWQSMPDERR